MSNVLQAKVKFVRNLKDAIFTTQANDNQLKDILKLCIDTCNELGLKAERLENLTTEVVESLMCENNIEPNFTQESSIKGFGSNGEVNVQINALNHIELFANNTNIFDAYSKAKHIDNKLCNKLNFAYSDKYGFLSPDLKQIGSGMQINVVLMLPALHKVGAVRSLPKINDKLSFTISAVNDSGLYIITTGATLGYTEKQICELTNDYIVKLEKLEVDMSTKLAENNLEILDNNLRAQAIINSCMLIDVAELNDLLGDIIIAINSGLEKNISMEVIINLFNCTQNINAKNKENLAKNIKNIIKSK